MSTSYTSISSEKLSRLIGTPNVPTLVDVRSDEDFAADPRLIPSAGRRSHLEIEEWAASLKGHSVVVICHKGQGLSEGRGRTVWVTRSRPKIDRIACPWLIRRFVDPAAVFLFVTSSEIESVAERFEATPFDVENVFWSHRGELCTFDVMVKEFGLSAPPIERLATMVRAADTGCLDLSPEAPGLLAASLGLSRMYDDDLDQLDAGLLLYAVFYRWCRDATNETHNWPTNKVKP